MCRHSSEWFPISVAVIVPVTFFATYSISVGLHHTDADFPYISDTGTRPPESCIFGQLLNITAVLVGITCYIRFSQLEEFCESNLHLRRANRVSLFFGMCSAFGMSLVGNFQETSVLVVHTTGAMLAFGFGVIYCWISTVIAFKVYPQLASKLVIFTRLVVCIVSTLCFVTSSIFAALANLHYKGHDRQKWMPHDGGFVYHVISSATEWAMAGVFIIYFLTFVPEFRRISVELPVVTYRRPEDQGVGLCASTDYYADDEDIIT